MAEQRYRFGGPIPESVLALQKRRRYRDSSLYAGVKKIRREKFWANPPAGWEQVHSNWGEVIGIRPVVAQEFAAAQCRGCARYQFLESEVATAVCSRGASCTSGPDGRAPFEGSAAPVAPVCGRAPSGSPR